MNACLKGSSVPQTALRYRLITNSIGAKTGIIVILVGALLIALLVFFLLCRRKCKMNAVAYPSPQGSQGMVFTSEIQAEQALARELPVERIYPPQLQAEPTLTRELPA